MRSPCTNLRAQLTWLIEEYRIRRLAALILFLIVIWFLAALCIWASERSPARVPRLHPGDTFYDFRDCLWCSTVYLVSGLEDFDPVTLPSKIAAVVVMVVGVGVLGLIGAQLLATFVDRQRLRTRIRRKPGCAFAGHVVVCGWNERGPAVIKHLRTHPLGRNGQVVVVAPEVLDIEIQNPAILRQVWGIPGEPFRETALRQADAETARALVILSAPASSANPASGARDAAGILAYLTAAAVAPGGHICVELADRRSAPRFRPLPGLELLYVRNLAGKLLAHSAREHGLIHCFQTLLDPEPHAPGIQFIPVPKKWLGRTFREVARAMLLDPHKNRILLGIRRPLSPAVRQDPEPPAPQPYTTILNPPARIPAAPQTRRPVFCRDDPLEPGDLLIVLTRIPGRRPPPPAKAPRLETGAMAP